MSNEDLKYDLENLQKLHQDLEKQMLSFDEIIPFERQRTSEIYSPRLLNMMLVCGAHIETVTKLISRRCDFNYDDLRSSIRKINEKFVLSKFYIISIPHEIQFTPFTDKLEWWESYNELKHELQEKQFKITYTRVMDAFACLSALHFLAQKLMSIQDNDEISNILNGQNWTQAQLTWNNPYVNSIIGKSLLFQIRNVYTPNM